MSQQLNNLSNIDLKISKSDLKDHLIKYCYFDSTSIGDSLRNYTIWLINQCNDDNLLTTIVKLFDEYIMPFYIDKTNRVYFNKLRHYFMKYVLILLIGEREGFSSLDDFYKFYPNLSIMAGILDEPKWHDIAMPLIAKAKEAYYDISVYS